MTDDEVKKAQAMLDSMGVPKGELTERINKMWAYVNAVKRLETTALKACDTWSDGGDLIDAFVFLRDAAEDLKRGRESGKWEWGRRDEE